MRARAVSVFVAVTFAPGTVAPEESFTTPKIVDVCCAKLGAAHSVITIAGIVIAAIPMIAAHALLTIAVALFFIFVLGVVR